MLFASGAYLFFDPLATLTRTATILLYPLLDRLVRLFSDVAYLAAPLRPGVDLVTGALTGRLVFSRPLVYGFQLAVLAMFSAMLAVSWLEPRMWCRDLCPLGALLGLVGRFAIVGRVVDADACISCGKCAQRLPDGGDSRRLPSHRHEPLPSLLRVRGRLPDGAVRLGMRPTTLAVLADSSSSADRREPRGARRLLRVHRARPAASATPGSSARRAAAREASCSRCARGAASA